MYWYTNPSGTVPRNDREETKMGVVLFRDGLRASQEDIRMSQARWPEHRLLAEAAARQGIEFEPLIERKKNRQRTIRRRKVLLNGYVCAVHRIFDDSVFQTTVDSEFRRLVEYSVVLIGRTTRPRIFIIPARLIRTRFLRMLARRSSAALSHQQLFDYSFISHYARYEDNWQQLRQAA